MPMILAISCSPLRLCREVECDAVNFYARRNMSVAVANFLNQERASRLPVLTVVSCRLSVVGRQLKTDNRQPSGTVSLIIALSSPQAEGPRMLPSPNRSQPAWISASTVQGAERERAFFRSVYSWMFGGLLLTAFASMWVATSVPM